MVDRKKELFLNTIIIGVGSIFTKALSFLLVPLLTAWLSTKEYGDYDLLFSYVSLCVPILTLQLEQAVLRFTLENKDKGNEYFTTCFAFLLLTSLIFIIIFSFLFKFEYHLSFSICTISCAFQTFTTEYVRGRNDLKLYSMINIFCGICMISLSYLLVGQLRTGVDGLLYSFAIAYFITSLLIIFIKKPFNNGSKFLFDLQIFKTLLKYSFPLLPNAISWWITNVSDRTLINIFLGSSFNGIYAVSTKIPTLMTVFYSVFNLAWQQSAILSSSDSIKEKTYFYNTTFKKLYSFLFSSGILVIAITPFIYMFLLDSSYSSGMNIVSILVLSTIFLNLGQYIGGILLGKMDTKTNGVTTVVAAIANLIINFLLISKLGLVAAAISTLVSYIILFILRIRKTSDFFNVKEIIPKILFSTCVYITISFIIFLPKNIIVQFVLLIVASLYFIYSNRTIVNNILKKLK